MNHRSPFGNQPRRKQSAQATGEKAPTHARQPSYVNRTFVIASMLLLAGIVFVLALLLLV